VHVSPGYVIRRTDLSRLISKQERAIKLGTAARFFTQWREVIHILRLVFKFII